MSVSYVACLSVIAIHVCHCWLSLPLLAVCHCCNIRNSGSAPDAPSCQWQTYSTTRSQCFYHHRCIRKEVGAVMDDTVMSGQKSLEESQIQKAVHFVLLLASGMMELHIQFQIDNKTEWLMSITYGRLTPSLWIPQQSEFGRGLFSEKFIFRQCISQEWTTTKQTLLGPPLTGCWTSLIVRSTPTYNYRIFYTADG